MEKPRFPLKSISDDGEEETYDSDEELAHGLEWFDSDSPDRGVVVVDADGRAVRILIVAHELRACELANPKEKPVDRR